VWRELQHSDPVFQKLGEIIADNLAAVAPDQMDGEIEVDESYFAGVRKGKRVSAQWARFPFSSF
jgi:hypothetical protein